MKDLKMLPSNYLQLGWNPNYLASNKFGQEINAKSCEAYQFSLWGSVVAAFVNKHISAYDCESLRRELLKIIPINYATIDAYDTNPYRSHTEIIKIMQQAEKVFFCKES